MAGTRKYQLPPVQVRELLAECRDRGLEFREAWELVVGEASVTGDGVSRVRWPHNSVERRSWRTAIVATRAAWRSAYERQPSNLSLALDALDLLPERSEPARAIRGDGRREVARLSFVLPPETISRRLGAERIPQEVA